VGALSDLLDPRVDSVEVHWRADEDAAVRLRERAGVHRSTSEAEVCTLPDLAAANDFVRAVLDASGTVRQLVPHRPGLEELFVHEAQRAEADA
jgi:hypothetical protein